MKGSIKNIAIVFAAIMTGIIFMSSIVVASPLQTDTGFVYPTGVKGPYLYTGWLAAPPAYPFPGYYHIGQDMESAVDTKVYAISDGEIIRVSDGSAWNAVASDKNYGIFVKHKLNDGKEFVALYGHVRPIDTGLMRNGIIDPPVKVYSGVAFATVGPFSTTPPIPHLHFGIYPGLDYPLSNWGRMPISQPGANGFVDPMNWITTKSPLQYLGAHIVTQSILCKNQACSTTSVVPGDELTFVFSINNPTTSDISNVRLGAQIRINSPQGAWQDDNPRDQVVTVTPGTKDYTRKFVIPTAVTTGFYDTRGVILNHGTGAWIDSKELIHVFEVKAATTTPPYSSFYEGSVVTGNDISTPNWWLKDGFKRKITDSATLQSILGSNGNKYWGFSSADINKIPQGADITISVAAYGSFYEGSVVNSGVTGTPNWWLKDNFKRKITDSATLQSILGSNGGKFWRFSSADIDKIPQGSDITITAAYSSFYEGSIVTGNDVSTPNYWLKDNFKRKIVDGTTLGIIYNSNGKKYWGFSSADINKIPLGADIKLP